MLALNPLPTSGWTDFSRSRKTAAEFAQEPSQFARMAPGPSMRRGRLAPPTPRIWRTAGALLAVACQGGGERPLETSPGLSLDPWGLAEPPTAAARASEPVIVQSAVGLIRTSGAAPRAPVVGVMLASLTVPDTRLTTDLLLPLLASSTRPAVEGSVTQRRDFDTGVLLDHSTRDHRHRTQTPTPHPPAALSPSRRLRGSAYHHVLSASGANTALLRGQKPTRARGRHGQKEAWGVGYTPSAGGG